MNLIIAKLEIIYTTLYNQVAVSEYHCQCRCTALTSIYKHGTGRGGRWRSACQLEQQHALSLCSVLCWLPLIASRNIGHLSIWDPIHRVVLTLLHTGLQILARWQCQEPTGRLKQTQLPAPDVRPAATIHPHWCSQHSSLLRVILLGHVLH